MNRLARRLAVVAVVVVACLGGALVLTRSHDPATPRTTRPPDAELAQVTPKPGAVLDPSYAGLPIPATPSLSGVATSTVRAIGGQVVMNVDAYAEPIYYRSSKAVAQRPVTCTTYDCVGGSSAPVIGDEIPASGSDGQLIIVDLATRVSYEFWHVAKDADGTVKINSEGSVSTGSMNVVPLDGGVNTSVDGKKLNINGAGVSRLLGVIRANEVRAAADDPRTAIRHALSVSLPPRVNCADGFVAPATKTDGQGTSAPCVKEGSRLRLDPTFDCTAVPSKMGQAVCHALQTYGAYDLDNGCDSVCVYAQQVDSWSTARSEYRAAGVTGDYFGLAIPLTRLQVLRSWDGG